MEKENLKELLKESSERKVLNFNELSVASGVSYETITRIVKDKGVSYRSIKRISDALIELIKSKYSNITDICEKFDIA